MSRIILACAIAAIFAMPAKADETVLIRSPRRRPQAGLAER
jgi:hypothetical protein